MSDTAPAVRSKMTGKDWHDIAGSEFVDYVEGRESFGLVFEHEEIGLHGLKFDAANGVLRPVTFIEKTDDDTEGDA